MGWRPRRRPPRLAYTVSKLLTLMITESDNTHQMLIAWSAAARSTRETDLGLTQTSLHDYIRSEDRSITRSFERQRHGEADDRDARFQLIDEWSSREMISIMTGQHHNG